MSEAEKDLEILALRSQLSILQQEIYNRKIPKPHFTPAFRQLWVLFSKILSNWESHLFLVCSKRTSFHSPWQNGICKRMVGILRAELLNHIVPINQRHLEYLLKEYINRYYNPVRTHQGINCTTPILSDKPSITKSSDTVLASEPVLGGLYHSYQKAA